MIWTLLTLAAGNPGMDSCRCASAHTEATSTYRRTVGSDEFLLYTDPETSVEYQLPNDYGLNECKKWDLNSGFCAPDSTGHQPIWCSDEWCYVDENACVGSDDFDVEQEGGALSEWFPDTGLRYSYATCGVASYFAKYTRAASMSATDLFAESEKFIRQMVTTVEDAADRIYGADYEGKQADCEFLDSCDCAPACKVLGGQWGSTELDLRQTTITYNSEERGKLENEARCIGRRVQSSFRAIAQQTYNDPNRVAYLYFGLQDNGSLLCWPGNQWCPVGANAYDARFRPWYAASASGPKDVVLTLDNSGSMSGSRWSLLVNGVDKILLTLTEYDYIGIILFSSDARAYKQFLVPATDAEKDLIKAWLRDPMQDPMGSTNFKAAFDETFAFIRESRHQRSTTKCQAAILFMTDGEDTSGFEVEALEELQSGLEPKTVIFTYTFGEDADQVLPRRIACAHDGIHYNVIDGNIGEVMSKYYTYFAEGVANLVPRWVTYTDAITGERLKSACLPAYKDSAKQHLLGVGCIDINIMIRLSLLEAKPMYDQFEDQVRTSSSQCVRFALAPEELKAMRDRSGEAANCEKGNDKASRTVIVVSAVAGGVVFLATVFVVGRRCCRRRATNVARAVTNQPRPSTQQQPAHRGSFGHAPQPPQQQHPLYGQSAAYNNAGAGGYGGGMQSQHAHVGVSHVPYATPVTG